MILIDTNVLIYGFDPESPFHDWARDTIAESISGDGGGLNAVSLAEICVVDYPDQPRSSHRLRDTVQRIDFAEQHRQRVAPLVSGR